MFYFFSKREKGLEHQIEMPDVPEPETLKSEQEIREEILKELKMNKEDMPMFIKQREIEMRPVEKQNYFKPERMPPYKNTWIKTEGLYQKINPFNKHFFYIFLIWDLLGAANNSVGVNFLTKNLQNASLDHAMWFHRKLDLDGWFLYTIESPITRNARGFSRGSIFSRDGKLIASCTQEGLNKIVGKLILSNYFS